MKRNYLIIILVSFVILYTGCFSNNQNNSENNAEECQYKYSITIQSNSSTHYDLNIPIPVYSNNNRIIRKSAISEGLEVISGDMRFEIENTSLGISLKINGTGNGTIISHGTDLENFLINNEYSQLFLSMAKDEDGDGYYDDEYGDMKYNIYCHQKISINVIIELDYYHEDGPGTYLSSNTEIQSEITKGWNTVDGSFLTVVE